MAGYVRNLVCTCPIILGMQILRQKFNGSGKTTVVVYNDFQQEEYLAFHFLFVQCYLVLYSQLPFSRDLLSIT